MRMTRAPSPTSFSIVGSAARMRVSSVTTPSFTGTLKSTRTSARLPAPSSSSMVLMLLIPYFLTNRYPLTREGIECST